MTSFDDSLWDRLMAEHDAHLVALGAPAAERPARRPLLVGGGVAVTAAATAAAVLAINAATTAPPAYALTQNPDGSVSVTINELSAAIPSLNAQFARMGINETVVPVTADCPSREFRLHAYASLHMTDTWTFKPQDSVRTPGWKGVLAAEQLPSGEVAVAQMVVPEPIPSCLSNVAYSAPQLTGKTDHGVPMATETAVNPATGAPRTP